MRGIGLSSAAHIGVLLDDRDQPVRRAILWSDQRSGEEAQHLEETVGATIFERSRNRVSTTWILSAVLKRPLLSMRDADSSHGAALLACAGVGNVDLARLLRAEGAPGVGVAPDQGWVQTYEDAFSTYRLIHRQMRDVYHRAGSGCGGMLS